MDLLFELYDVHLKVKTDTPESFEEFIHWGQTLLTDFNDIDQYLVDTQLLFKYLDETKAIKLWNLDGKPLTDFEKEYLKFFNSLDAYYSLLKEKLLQRNTVYQGLANRYLAENPSAITLTDKTILFCGFNALTDSEKAIIKHLHQSCNVELIWDADNYYFDDPIQEAGFFLRNNLKKIPSDEIKWINNDLLTDKKEINIYAVPKKAGQAKYAGQLLKEIDSGQSGQTKTAVILNEEHLLIPLLNALPENVESCNITMGMPLSRNAMYNLIAAIFRLHVYAEQSSGKKEGSDIAYYYRNILLILNNPYIQNYFISDHEHLTFSEYLQKSNKGFYTLSELSKLLASCYKEHEVLMKFFVPWKNDTGIGLELTRQCIGNIKKKIKSGLQQKDYTAEKLLELEYIFYFNRICEKIERLNSKYSFLKHVKSLLLLFEHYTIHEKIPFYGEPLKGIQIMGMLETRTLDFEQVIMLSVNEGILPSGKTGSSFIPFDIKREFGLPTHIEKDSIFAYHFYRLLQRSKKVSLIYDTEGSSIGGGDKSRFITQIMHELPKSNPNIRITQAVVSTPIPSQATQPDIFIQNSKQIIQKILETFNKGISPSAISTYKRCRLQFYFSVITKIPENETVEEKMEASTLGNIIHDALRRLYEPFTNQSLNEDTFKIIKSMEASAIADAFSTAYPDGDISNGKNYLLFDVIRNLIASFIDAELARIRKEKNNENLQILFTEKKLQHAFSLGVTDNAYPVTFKGIADRIDLLNKTIRIVDYKTGKVLPNELRNWGIPDLFEGTKYDKAFQLVYYSYLLRFDESFRNNPETFPESGIFSLQQPRQELIKLIYPQATNAEDFFSAFQHHLQEFLKNMLNPDNGFEQTTDTAHCEYCGYRLICNR